MARAKQEPAMMLQILADEKGKPSAARVLLTASLAFTADPNRI